MINGLLLLSAVMLFAHAIIDAQRLSVMRLACVTLTAAVCFFLGAAGVGA